MDFFRSPENLFKPALASGRPVKAAVDESGAGKAAIDAITPPPCSPASRCFI